MSIGSEGIKGFGHVIPKTCLGSDFLLKTGILAGGGQFTVQEEICGFEVGGFFRKLFDGVPSVTEDSFFAIDEGDFALTGTGVAVTIVKGDATACSP